VLNVNSRTLDELAARIGKAVEASPAKDIEKNVKALLQSGLLRLDLVTRQEFDTQAQVLLRTREKVERLEARLAEIERQAGLAPTASAGPSAPADAPAPPMGPAE
jgi:BMFP domain-containing protein YqiC